jgi:hypothetical protein
MPITIVPVTCPNCGEAQNMTPGDFDPEADPFGPVTCMACRREFEREEYLAGLKKRLAETGTPP